jgi:hypothetical protein
MLGGHFSDVLGKKRKGLSPYRESVYGYPGPLLVRFLFGEGEASLTTAQRSPL